MKWKNAGYAGVLIMAMIGMSLSTAVRAEEDAPRITKEEVKALLGDTGVTILDARTGASWESSDKKIKGAVRVDPDNVASWAGSIPKDKKIIVYCS
jgi:rhodanese-related sulfurtransferase